MIDRTFYLMDESVRENLYTVIKNLPVNGSLQVVIGEKKKVRSLDQNALMWVGPLKDVSEQAWVDGKQYSSEVWHQFFKEKFLPDGSEEDYFRRITKLWLGKWEFSPDGRRFLVGSTTHLTSYGMALYITELEAYAASELGVRFHVRQH